MSHYYADVNHPFHTGQTDKEGQIHSYTEFGAADIYKDLRKHMTIDEPIKVNKIEDFVFKAAKESHKTYEDLLLGFDIEAGEQFKWGKGYSPELRHKIAPNIARAIWGTASLFRQGIVDSGAEDPGEINLALKKFATRITTPAEWIRRWLDKRRRKRRTRSIRRERRKSGRVRKSLSPDDKDYHKALDNGEIEPVKLTRKRPTQRVAEDKKSITTKKEKKPKTKKRKWNPAITPNSSIDDAAEVGSATAKRFQEIGLQTVKDFMDKSAEEIVELLKKELDYTRLDLEDISRMQAETQLMLDVPRLRVHDSVILYGAGIKSKDSLSKHQQDDLWDKVQEAIKDDHVKRYIRRKNLRPDFEEIGEWLESAQD
ncbi:MAG: DUF4332 domain-containing protein [Candidatus Heimdallarchaeota archaeon]|nr:DUF4332 domain-containing protein [Candidatus Heimdallarchaeota archaeon]